MKIGHYFILLRVVPPRVPHIARFRSTYYFLQVGHLRFSKQIIIYDIYNSCEGQSKSKGPGGGRAPWWGQGAKPLKLMLFRG